LSSQAAAAASSIWLLSVGGMGLLVKSHGSGLCLWKPAPGRYFCSFTFLTQPARSSALKASAKIKDDSRHDSAEALNDQKARAGIDVCVGRPFKTKCQAKKERCCQRTVFQFQCHGRSSGKIREKETLTLGRREHRAIAIVSRPMKYL